MPARFDRRLDSHQHDIGKILVESMEHESAALALYEELLSAVEGRSVMLEEYARQMVHAEELHAGEVDKMLRKPGAISTSGLGPKTLESPNRCGPDSGQEEPR